MNCEQTRKELVAWLDDELEACARAEVEKHLEDCTACQQELKALSLTLQRVSQSPSLLPSPDFERKFWELLSKEQQGLRQKIRQYLVKPYRALVVGFSVAATVLVLVLLIHPQDRRSEFPDEDATMIASNFDFFNDYEIIQQLDILEDLEYIESLQD